MGGLVAAFAAQDLRYYCPDCGLHQLVQTWYDGTFSTATFGQLHFALVCNSALRNY